jgi:hypothetical protein
LKNHSGYSFGLDEASRLRHISFGSLWLEFNNRRASPRRFWLDMMSVGTGTFDTVFSAHPKCIVAENCRTMDWNTANLR